MTFYRDLDPCGYFGLADPRRLLAVGWLERGHDFPRGNTSTEFRSKLHELLSDPWQPVFLMGPHFCTLCAKGERRAGVRNLFVPGAGVLYAAPELIEHYMLDHAYGPPQEFIDAVLRCPAMSSREYHDAIAKAGPSFERPSFGMPF
jgi:hypothetical protein